MDELRIEKKGEEEWTKQTSRWRKKKKNKRKGKKVQYIFSSF